MRKFVEFANLIDDDKTIFICNARNAYTTRKLHVHRKVEQLIHLLMIFCPGKEIENRKMEQLIHLLMIFCPGKEIENRKLEIGAVYSSAYDILSG